MAPTGSSGVHRPRNPDPARVEGARWFDGEGRALDDQFRTRRIFSQYGRSNYALAQLNHYPLGAMESYVLKADRGRAVHSDHLLGLDYWVERNFNSDEDRSILALSPQVAAQRAVLARDAELSSLHDAAVAWRQARVRGPDAERALPGASRAADDDAAKSAAGASNRRRAAPLRAGRARGRGRCVSAGRGLCGGFVARRALTDTKVTVN